MRATNPSREDMAKVTGYYATLYQWETPSPPLPGRPVPTHVTPFKVNDKFPMKGGWRQRYDASNSIKQKGKPTSMQFFLINDYRRCTWWRGRPPPPRLKRCQKLVEITQLMWQHRNISRELGWKILVIITKGNTDTRGVSLL